MRQWEFKVDIYFCNRPRALENTNDQIAIGFSLPYWLSRRRKLDLFIIFFFLNVDKKFIFYHDRIVARERIQQINLLRSRFLGGTSHLKKRLRSRLLANWPLFRIQNSNIARTLVENYSFKYMVLLLATYTCIS